LKEHGERQQNEEGKRVIGSKEKKLKKCGGAGRGGDWWGLKAHRLKQGKTVSVS